MEKLVDLAKKSEAKEDGPAKREEKPFEQVDEHSFDVEGGSTGNPNATPAEEIPVTIEPSENPAIQMIFFRHGQHASVVHEHESGLSPVGIEEMRSLGKEIGVNEEQAIAFYTGNLRSLSSVVLGLLPNLDEKMLPVVKRELLRKGQVRVLSKLNYKPIPEGEFEEGLESAVLNDKVLRFLVNKSDALAKDSHEVSTYNDIGRNMAGLLKKYVQIEKSWAQISEQKGYADKNLYRLFCGREFIFASFRAKLVEKVNGRGARNKFITEYEATGSESQDRHSYTRITIENSKSSDGPIKIGLEDSYGKLVFDENTLDMIMHENADSIRRATYVIPYRRSSQNEIEVAILSYSDGFGFIGGRANDSETPKEALDRETMEELGKTLSVFKDLSPVEWNYEFEMAEGARMDDPNKHIEQHHFFIGEVDTGLNLEYKEQTAHVVWVPLNSLLDESVIKFPELRSYLQQTVIQKLNKETSD